MHFCRPDFDDLNLELLLEPPSHDWDPDVSTCRTKSVKSSELDFSCSAFVGEGSCSTVRSAVHIPSQVAVVCKEISFHRHGNREAIQRELNVFSSCESPFIVQFYGCVAEKGMPHILLVMERLDGSLFDLLTTVQKASSSATHHLMPERVCRAMVRQILGGLLFLHGEKHLIHRDLKPSNILFSRSTGEVKLTDFGVSSRSSLHGSSMHTYIGSKSYMSPERFLNEGHSFPADIWSLGLTILQALTGIHPYARYEPDESGSAIRTPLTGLRTMEMIKADPPVAVASEVLSETGADFVTQCLVVNKAMRPGVQELVKHAWVSSMTLEESRRCLVDYCEVILPPRGEKAKVSSQQLQVNKKLEGLSLGIGKR